MVHPTRLLEACHLDERFLNEQGPPHRIDLVMEYKLERVSFRSDFVAGQRTEKGSEGNGRKVSNFTGGLNLPEESGQATANQAVMNSLCFF